MRSVEFLIGEPSSTPTPLGTSTPRHLEPWQSELCYIFRMNGNNAAAQAEEQLSRFSKGVEEILPTPEILKTAIEKSLTKNEPLRVKWGVDPTAPDLHLGHSVLLRKLRQFQDMGHLVILIIGDFTARIGDPSGRKATRPPLTGEQIDANAKTYTDQAFKVLDPTRTEIVYNSQWLSRLGFEDVIKLAGHFTIARLLERDDFSKRMAEQAPISLHELLYPIMQAYDSVEIRADVEFGGTEQKFNLLAGRQLQEDFDQPAQICLTMPILEGTDGVRRMSKSLGNYVGIAEDPAEMFGKIYSIPDSLISRWFHLCTDLNEVEIEAIEAGIKANTIHPGEKKRELAKTIITLYWNVEAAEEAEKQFDRVFKESGIPENIPHIYIENKENLWLPKLLVMLNLANSNREAKEFISSGGVKIDGQVQADFNQEISIKTGMIFQVGKRKFAKID